MINKLFLCFVSKPRVGPINSKQNNFKWGNIFAGICTLVLSLWWWQTTPKWQTPWWVIVIEILLYKECWLGVSSHFGMKTSGAIIRCKNWCSIGIYLIFLRTLRSYFILWLFPPLKSKTNYTQITHALFLTSNSIFYIFFKFLYAPRASQFEFKIM